MTTAVLQNDLYSSFGVINSFPISEYQHTNYNDYALSVLERTDKKLDSYISNFWKIPFIQKEMDYNALVDSLPLFDTLRDMTLQTDISDVIRQSALHILNKALEYRTMLIDYFQEREIFLSNAKRMAAPVIEKYLENEV